MERENEAVLVKGTKFQLCNKRISPRGLLYIIEPVVNNTVLCT